jgi:uncharacterized membrane protein YgcG
VSSPAEPGRGPASGAGRGEAPQNIATAISEVSERAATLVHEEVELAKAEFAEKTAELMRGAAVAAAAGVFILMAVILALIGGAWVLYFYLPVPTYAFYWGFFAMAAILLVVAAGAGLLAYRIVKRSSPPVPTMAIDEAKKIRDTVSATAEGGPGAGAAGGFGAGTSGGNGAGVSAGAGAGPAGPAGGQVS